MMPVAPMGGFSIYFIVNVAVDVLAAAVGAVAIYYLVRLDRLVSGQFKAALWYMIIGVLTYTSAMVWPLLGDPLMAQEPGIDMHHLLMAIGMIFTVVSIYKFSKLVLPPTA